MHRLDGIFNRSGLIDSGRVPLELDVIDFFPAANVDRHTLTSEHLRYVSKAGRLGYQAAVHEERDYVLPINGERAQFETQEIANVGKQYVKAGLSHQKAWQSASGVSQNGHLAVVMVTQKQYIVAPVAFSQKTPAGLNYRGCL
jgi:hypothetical protein